MEIRLQFISVIVGPVNSLLAELISNDETNAVLDAFTHVLGPFSLAQNAVSSIMKTEFNKLDIINPAGEKVQEKHLKTSPDHLLLQGHLTSGALVSISYRMPPSSAIDEIGIRWLITGTHGQIEVLVPEMQWQFSPPGTTLRLKIGDGKTENVDWEGEAQEMKEVTERVFPGVNTARAWEAFAAVQRGDEGVRDRYPDFADAVLVHGCLDMIKKSAGW